MVPCMANLLLEQLPNFNIAAIALRNKVKWKS